MTGFLGSLPANIHKLMYFPKIVVREIYSSEMFRFRDQTFVGICAVNHVVLRRIVEFDIILPEDKNYLNDACIVLLNKLESKRKMIEL